MKYFTMVMRSGNVKDNPNMMMYTLIGDDLSITNLPGTKLAEAINTKKINVVNMAVTSQGLVSTNGSIKNYTTIGPDGNFVGTPRNVILGRHETNGKLTSYVIFGVDGRVGVVSPAQAAQLAQQGLLANGKVRHTDSGDIVAAIGGTYPLIEEKVATEPDTKAAKITVDVVFFGSAIGKDSTTYKFGGVIVTGQSVPALNKIRQTMEKGNEQIKSALKAHRGYTDETLAGFNVKLAPGAGFYGVYPLEFIRNLLKLTNGAYKASIKHIMIGCTDCTEDDHPETIVIYDTKEKAVVKAIKGNDKSEVGAKKYYKYITENFLK